MFNKSILYKLAFTFVLTLTLIACGGGDDGDVVVIPEKTSLPGTWHFCNEFEATSSQFTYIFTGTRFTKLKSDYLNNSCSGPAANGFDELHTGTYTIGTQTNSGSEIGAFLLNMEIETAFGVPVDPYMFYQIYGIAGNVLYLGDNTGSQDGFSAINRPNSLLLSEDYIREASPGSPQPGDYTGSLAANYSASNFIITLSGCMDPLNNGDVTLDTASFSMVSGDDTSYQAIAIYTLNAGPNVLTLTHSITGSISAGNLIGSFTSVFAVNGSTQNTGDGTFSGTLSGDSLNISFIDQDRTGDTCQTVSSIDFIASAN